MKWKEAERLFEQALKREPEGKNASYVLLHLAQCAAATKDFQKAKSLTEKWIAQFPDGSALPMQMSSLASIHVELKEDEKAIELLEELIEKFPNSAHTKSAKEQLKEVRSKEE